MFLTEVVPIWGTMFLWDPAAERNIDNEGWIMVRKLGGWGSMLCQISNKLLLLLHVAKMLQRGVAPSDHLISARDIYLVHIYQHVIIWAQH